MNIATLTVIPKYAGEQDVLPPAVYEVSSLRWTPNVALHHLQRPPDMRRGLQGLQDDDNHKEQTQQRGKILGAGRAKVLKKWEKWSGAYCCVDQLRCLKWAGKECDGEHICGGGEFMQMWIFGRCTGMVSLLVQRLFQVSHWPCICHSKSTCTHYWFSMALYALHFTVLNSIAKCVLLSSKVVVYATEQALSFLWHSSWFKDHIPHWFWPTLNKGSWGFEYEELVRRL